ADLDGALDVTAHDLRFEEREELVLVNGRFHQVNGALDDDGEDDDRGGQNGPHTPTAFLKCVGQILQDAHSQLLRRRWWWGHSTQKRDHCQEIERLKNFEERRRCRRRSSRGIFPQPVPARLGAYT